MPERWKHELGRLGHVDAPVDRIKARAAQGPTGEPTTGLPPRRQRVIAGVVAFAVFIGAGTFAWQAFRSGPMPATAPNDVWPVATIELTNDGAAKHASLSIDGDTQEGVFGTSTSTDEEYPYSWTNPDIGKPIVIPFGSELRLDGDVQVKEILFGNADELDAGKGPDSGPISSDQPVFDEPYFPPVDDTQREYWKVFGTWADGSVLDVYFEVRGAEPDVDLSDDSVDMVLTPETMEAALLYGDQRYETMGSGNYGGMSVIGEFVGFHDSTYFPVAAGSTLNVVSDDLRSWEARFGRFDGADGTVAMVIPHELGRTTMRLEVDWGGGAATFLFPIEVSAAPVPGEGATLSFVARNAPEAWLVFEGESQMAETPEYDWCDQAGCVNGSGYYESDPPQDEFLDIPSGTTLTLEGSNLTAIKGEFRTMDGEKASETIERPGQLGTVALDEGKYVLELHVALDGENGDHGSATFRFGVRVAATQVVARVVPSGDVSDVLRVSCSASGTEVSTPVVSAQPDGVHLEIDDTSGAARGVNFIWAHGGRYHESIGFGVNALIVPIPPGIASVACVPADMEQGSATITVSTAFEVSDPGDHFRSSELDCDAPQMLAVVLEASDADAAGHEMWDRVEGILDADVVEPEGYPGRQGQDWEDSVFWGVVVRDGDAVASLRLDYSGTLEVVSCAGSGVRISGPP